MQAGSNWCWKQREAWECKYLPTESDFTFESWRGLSQLRLCVVDWVWGSDWGRDCGGQESDTVSVSGQPQMRAQYRCTVHSTQYTACYRERSKLEPREKFTLAQLWQKYINTVKLLLSLECDTKSGSLMMRRCFVCCELCMKIRFVFPLHCPLLSRKISPSFLMHNPTTVKSPIVKVCD